MRPFHPSISAARNCRLLAKGYFVFAANQRRTLRSQAGVTLVETMISLMIIVIGLAGLFGTSARSFTLLRRSKEVVAVRESLLTRLDGIRALSFTEVARATPISGSPTGSGSGSLKTSLLNTDPTPFTVTLDGMKNFTETITVYALGAQLFSSDAQRTNATPDYANEYASQVDSVAPDAPTTYKSGSTTKGDWALQVGNSLPYYKITRTGTGSTVSPVVDYGTSGNGDLSAYPQLLVDVVYSWTDSNNITRSQVGCMIVARNGSL